MKEKITKYTSANMDGEVYDEIMKACADFDIQEDIIFKDLITLTKHNIHSSNIYGILTEYQNHSPERWETLYYSLNEDEIEIFGKTRQKYKISISKLAFIGFVLFWELLIYTYKERLKKCNVKDIFFSYKKVHEKFKIYEAEFMKRLNNKQKE